MSNHKIGASRLSSTFPQVMENVLTYLRRNRPFGAMKAAEGIHNSVQDPDLRKLKKILRDGAVCEMLSQGIDLNIQQFRALIFAPAFWGEEVDDEVAKRVPGCRTATNKLSFCVWDSGWELARWGDWVF